MEERVLVKKMIDIKVVFFASFKEQLGCSQMEQSLEQGATIADLCRILSGQGGQWQTLFSEANKNVKVACNHQMAEMSTILNQSDEVAFFPPVTGG